MMFNPLSVRVFWLPKVSVYKLRFLLSLGAFFSLKVTAWVTVHKPWVFTFLLSFLVAKGHCLKALALQAF